MGIFRRNTKIETPWGRIKQEKLDRFHRIVSVGSERTTIDRDTFFKEFRAFEGTSRSWISIFGAELANEPQIAKIVSIRGIGTKELRAMLKLLEYKAAVLAGFRGEDLRLRLKKSLEGGKQRHLKGWDMQDVGCVFLTAHDEIDPVKGLLSRRVRETIKSHGKTGQGDYYAGTKNFMQELNDFFRRLENFFSDLKRY